MIALTRRDRRETRMGIAGMLPFAMTAALLTWLAGSCSPDPAYAQQPPAVAPVATGTLPVITNIRFAWPTPAVREQLVSLWTNEREFGACVMQIRIYIKDTLGVRDEMWIVDSIVAAKSRVADETTLLDSHCPAGTVGFIHSHPKSRVCNLSSGDLLAGSLFQFPLSGVVCGPDGSIGFAFNPLIPPAIPVPPSEPPSARLPPDSATKAPPARGQGPRP